MILHTENGTFTDDTKAVGERITFVKTAQNIKYFDGKAPSVSTRELLKLLDLGSMRVVGVTGTNGKTTVTAGIYSVLLDLGEKVALQGTRGFFINENRVEEKSLTTPPILQTIAHMYEAKRQGCGYFIMEVSSHAIAQNRIENLPFALKVHTNVTGDHLDFHGSLAEYRRVKQSFFADRVPKLINRDERFDVNLKNAQSYGIENPATFKVLAYKLTDGIEAVLNHFEQTQVLRSPMQGAFNLYNLLAIAASVKMLTGAPLERICEELEYFGGVSGRMEVVSEEPLVIVDFAHTHDGIKKVVESFPSKDVAVVFGAGGDRDSGKRPLMGKAAAAAKKIYLTSDNPRSEDPQAIIEQILQGVYNREKVRVNPDRKEAIARAIKELESGEVLLVLGKGDETYQEVKGEKIPMNDKQMILELLEKTS